MIEIWLIIWACGISVDMCQEAQDYIGIQQDTQFELMTGG